MGIKFEQIKVIPADIDNENHRKGVWIIRNGNTEYNRITAEPIPYKDHCEWWRDAFEKEYIFIVYYKSKVTGYIRLTKFKTNSKEKHEISIALSKKYQNVGVGSYAYNLFEDKMRKIKIPQIIASTYIENEASQKFFERNKFERIDLKNEYVRFVKKL